MALTTHRHLGRAPASRTVLAIVVGALLLASPAPPARAASPSPTVVAGGDARSEGEGAGLVGAPLLVAFAVLAIGAVTALVTIVFVRLGRDGS